MLNAVRRANLEGRLLCRRNDELSELEWRGEIVWVSGGALAFGGYWAARRSYASTVHVEL